MSEELNRRLALQYGFTFETIVYDTSFCGAVVEEWYDPNGRYCGKLPEFTSSLDACFKWLVPKLVSIRIKTWNYGGYGSQVTVFVNGEDTVGWADTPALALCLAIEKLIDAEEV